MKPIIEISSLTRYYGDLAAVNGLDISVETGVIHGFLGPNGSGKTTAIRMMMNFIRPNDGKIKIFDKELKWGDFDYLKNIGYLPGEVRLPDHLSGLKLLRYWESLSGRKADRRDLLLERLSLTGEDLQKKTGEYSRGMKQKLGIVGAIQCSPELLILDEPTEGLDPLVKHSFLELLKELKHSGTTIFFSSHILSEVEQIADIAGIIRKGKLVANSSIEDFKHHGGKNVEICFIDEIQAQRFRELCSGNCTREGKRVKFFLEKNIKSLFEVLADFEIVDINICDPTLEDIFLEYYEAVD